MHTLLANTVGGHVTFPCYRKRNPICKNSLLSDSVKGFTYGIFPRIDFEIVNTPQASLIALCQSSSLLEKLIYGPGISITPVDCPPPSTSLQTSQTQSLRKRRKPRPTKNSQLILQYLNSYNAKGGCGDQIEPPCVKEETESESEHENETENENNTPSMDESQASSHTDAVHCDICDQTYINSVVFALHSIVHNNDNKYSCHFCEYRNTSKYHIEMHVKAHEGNTKYKCEICQKAFTVSTHAAEHKNFHTGEKPFQCEICGKHFMFSWFLTSHRRTQHWEIMTGTPLVKYDCTTCNKHYTSSTGLRRHNMSKHNVTGVDSSVLCDICGKSLSSAEKLKFHRRIHTGYKPYSCEVCCKSFSRKEQLKEHERVHTGEKPFICNFCGKGFTQRSPLRIHERTHTGERPYLCRICGKGFISKGVMDNHMKNCTVPMYYS